MKKLTTTALPLISFTWGGLIVYKNSLVWMSIVVNYSINSGLLIYAKAKTFPIGNLLFLEVFSVYVGLDMN